MTTQRFAGNIIEIERLPLDVCITRFCICIQMHTHVEREQLTEYIINQNAYIYKRHMD